MAWACRALDNAPNSAPQCSERVVKACCNYSSYNRQLLLWVTVMESRKTSMVAAIHHSVCSPGADQGKWLYLIHLTELLSTEEEKPIYNPNFFLKYPWQTNSKGVIASQLDWDFRGPAETVDSPVAKVMVLEKWTRLHWSIRHYVGSLLCICALLHPFPSSSDYCIGKEGLLSLAFVQSPALWGYQTLPLLIPQNQISEE